jgi:hypothetical protein
MPKYSNDADRINEEVLNSLGREVTTRILAESTECEN